MNAPARQQQSDRAPVALPHQPAAARTGQGTAIEQSRAAAEVYARVLVAQQSPRDEQAARRRMLDACGMSALAERSFFRFNRGGQVSGPSVHLARELARCWGNVDSGVFELSRDDAAAQSEMQAFAWDLETNARTGSIFIVPHKRDKRGGPELLTDMRDIYENNANAGARRLREAIFALLPVWFREEAIETCNKTLEDGGGEPLPQRIAKMTDWYHRRHHVTEQQLITKLGRPTSHWTVHDLAQLQVIGQSLSRGEVTVDDEFTREGGDTVTAAEVTGRRSRAGTTTPPEPPAATPPIDPPAAASPSSDEEDEAYRQIEADRDAAAQGTSDDTAGAQ